MAFDDRFARHAAVTIASIFVNAKQSNPKIHILTPGLSEDSIRLIADICIRFGREAKIYEQSMSELKKLPISSYISRATYLRLMISDIVGETRKLIYLDADVVVDADLTELYQINIGDALFAGVIDVAGSGDAAVRLKLGLDPYLNAGVLLVNAEAWRSEKVISRTLEWANKHKDKIKWMDQDILNGALAGRKHVLPDIWHTLLVDVGPLGAKEYANRPRSEQRIFHFNGIIKPWMAWSDPWSQGIYDRYASLAFGSYEKIQPTTLEEAILLSDSYELSGDDARASRLRREIIIKLLEKTSA